MCWLLLAIADYDTIHFGCLDDNRRLVNIIQAVLVTFSLGYKSPLKLMQLNCSLSPDSVAGHLLDAINGPYSLLVRASYFISCSVHA